MIIIPARLESTRFPNKVLCDIGGLPMVIRVALNAQRADDVVVACDDECIETVCARYKIPCVLTSKEHSSGTDRCAQAAKKLGLKDDEMVLNIQADEPFLETEVIVALQNLMREKRPFMASLAKVVDKEQVGDRNLVKVVCNAYGEGIYFSRLPIPFHRDELRGDGQCGVEASYLGHLGLYGFCAGSLQEFCALPKSPLEEIEKLEQLRAIYHKKSIAMGIVETQSVGIDTLEDYQMALQRFAHLL